MGAFRPPSFAPIPDIPVLRGVLRCYVDHTSNSFHNSFFVLTGCATQMFESFLAIVLFENDPLPLPSFWMCSCRCRKRSISLQAFEEHRRKCPILLKDNAHSKSSGVTTARAFQEVSSEIVRESERKNGRFSQHIAQDIVELSELRKARARREFVKHDDIIIARPTNGMITSYTPDVQAIVHVGDSLLTQVIRDAGTGMKETKSDTDHDDALATCGSLLPNAHEEESFLYDHLQVRNFPVTVMGGNCDLKHERASVDSLPLAGEITGNEEASTDSGIERRFSEIFSDSPSVTSTGEREVSWKYS